MNVILSFLKEHLASCIILTFFVCILIPNLGSIFYLIGEFIIISHYTLNVDCLTTETKTTYPKHIHQIYTGYDGKPIPSNYLENIKTWKNNFPNYNYTLWNARMIEELIKHRYTELEDLYFGYSQWINRVDMSKYVIMYEYGGIYADLDIFSTKTNTSFPSSNQDIGVILYRQFQMGLKADFFMAKRKHPFFKHVLSGLQAANRWFLLPHLTTMFRAGPLFLHGRYLNYPCRGQIHLSTYDAFGTIFHDNHSGSWHRYDTLFMDVFFDYFYLWVLLFCFVCLVLCNRNIYIRAKVTSYCCVDGKLILGTSHV